MKQTPSSIFEIPTRAGMQSVCLALAGICQTWLSPADLCAAPAAGLTESLTFFAGFDKGVNATFARGDALIYTAKDITAPRVGTPGLPADGSVSIAKGEGVHGDALRFHKKSQAIVFYKAAQNMDYRASGWNGTVSLWLKLSPDEDLEPGYCDPLQITPRDWNDACFFVDFSKDEKPRHFRLGVFSDSKSWNPEGLKWEAFPEAQRPMVTVTQPPFRRDRWTHVAFTFENFNTAKKDASAWFYLDGKLQGELKGKSQTFTWDIDKTLIMFGIYYTGLFDELAVFNRRLSASEVESIRGLRRGVGELLKKAD